MKASEKASRDLVNILSGKLKGEKKNNKFFLLQMLTDLFQLFYVDLLSKAGEQLSTCNV